MRSETEILLEYLEQRLNYFRRILLRSTKSKVFGKKKILYHCQYPSMECSKKDLNIYRKDIEN